MYLKKLPDWFRPFPASLNWSLRHTDKLLLSFDDGPNPKSTPVILDKLSNAGIKAQFFCLGNQVQKHPELYMQILDHGHGTGNHGFNHISGWKCSPFCYMKNALKASQLIDSIYFRPPYGRISPQQINALSTRFKIIMWNRMPGDFNQSESLESFNKHSIPDFKNGDIIVLHDKPEYLPKTLSYLDKIASISKRFGLLDDIMY